MSANRSYKSYRDIKTFPQITDNSFVVAPRLGEPEGCARDRVVEEELRPPLRSL